MSKVKCTGKDCSICKKLEHHKKKAKRKIILKRFFLFIYSLFFIIGLWGILDLTFRNNWINFIYAFTPLAILIMFEICCWIINGKTFFDEMMKEII